MAELFIMCDCVELHSHVSLLMHNGMLMASDINTQSDHTKYVHTPFVPVARTRWDKLPILPTRDR